MTPIPTLHLRFVEKNVIVSQDQFSTIAKTQRVLQQFWQSPHGKEVAGDMFDTVLGEWRDVPCVGGAK